MSTSILVCGASARAAAFSCLRAGYSPLAADCFADRDLRAFCTASRIGDYPRGLLEIVQRNPAECWMYTGGLENHAGLVDRMAAILPLLGICGDSLRQVRDPWRLQAALDRHGLLSPPLLADAPIDGDAWLRKPINSCGGANIRRASCTPAPAFASGSVNQDARTHDPAQREYYFQRFIDGSPLSAAYVAADGRAVLLGACSQLLGQAWTGASGFQYCGAVGPLHLSVADRRQLTRLGDAVAREFSLVGVFGIDAVRRGRQLWTLEVNPRFTASMELLERGLSASVAELHVAACRERRLPSSVPGPAHVATSQGRHAPVFLPSKQVKQQDACRGKAIVFARRRIVVSDEFSDWADGANAGGAWPQVADLPSSGETIEMGRPVTTVFAAGETSRQTIAALHQAVGRVQQLLDC